MMIWSEVVKKIPMMMMNLFLLMRQMILILMMGCHSLKKRKLSQGLQTIPWDPLFWEEMKVRKILTLSPKSD